MGRDHFDYTKCILAVLVVFSCLVAIITAAIYSFIETNFIYLGATMVAISPIVNKIINHYFQ